MRGSGGSAGATAPRAARVAGGWSRCPRARVARERGARRRGGGGRGLEGRRRAGSSSSLPSSGSAAAPPGCSVLWAPAAMFTRAVSRLSRKRPPSGKRLRALGSGKGRVAGSPGAAPLCRPDSSRAPPRSLRPRRGGSAEPGSRPRRKLGLTREPQQLSFWRGSGSLGRHLTAPRSEATWEPGSPPASHLLRRPNRKDASLDLGIPPSGASPRRQKVVSQGGCALGRGRHLCDTAEESVCLSP